VALPIRAKKENMREKQEDVYVRRKIQAEKNRTCVMKHIRKRNHESEEREKRNFICFCFVFVYLGFCTKKEREKEFYWASF
jgi:hypothetical protein